LLIGLLLRIGLLLCILLGLLVSLLGRFGSLLVGGGLVLGCLLVCCGILSSVRSSRILVCSGGILLLLLLGSGLI
jgi:hypothetical protein